MNMKAVWYTHQGKPTEVMQFGEQPTPHASTGEVRVRLHASGVNPADSNRTVGRTYAMEGPLIIPNSDGAGIVDEVGDGVDASWLNRRAWLYNCQRGGRLLGTAAEYIALNADLVSELPDNTGYNEGACLGIPCMTAHRCVTLFGNSGGDLKNKTVLVTGGAGAVGHYAVQWAKRFGARVIATISSPEKAAHAAAAGADFTVNYRSEDVVARVREFTANTGVHHVVDVDFGGNLATTLPLLAANGSIAYYATKGNVTPTITAPELMRKNLSVHGVLLNGTPLAARQRAQMDIAQWLKEGGMRHTVSAVFPLANTGEAHEAVEFQAKLGTVVVDCES
ncbi:MAG TPA: NADPH:quinone reductase [Burkholderiales bacterium]|nr:NADPH:quinone reductase [Burkholderiales bacterium]